ncbi:hypothetical protein [Streptomyces globosus]|uniref:hypothetical protein n=1 Tax=Streptomyces globosus TaxID=68209 RepID=UPI001FEC7ECB|nr:hypothetical protein [Streptomyces globosus]
MQDEACDGGATAIVGDTGQVAEFDADVGKIADGEPSGDQERAVLLRDHGGDLAVGLVVDLADDLLQEVFDGDNPLDGAVLAGDERELLPFGTEVRSASEIFLEPVRTVAGWASSATGGSSRTGGRVTELATPTTSSKRPAARTGAREGPEFASAVRA